MVPVVLCRLAREEARARRGDVCVAGVGEDLAVLAERGWGESKERHRELHTKRAEGSARRTASVTIPMPILFAEPSKPMTTTRFGEGVSSSTMADMAGQGVPDYGLGPSAPARCSPGLTYPLAAATDQGRRYHTQLLLHLLHRFVTSASPSVASSRSGNTLVTLCAPTALLNSLLVEPGGAEQVAAGQERPAFK